MALVSVRLRRDSNTERPGRELTSQTEPAGIHWRDAEHALRSAAMPRVVVIGARRRRQGIGPFVARSFHSEGAELVGVVGTTDVSAREAARELADCGAHPRPYGDLETALVQEEPDIVAICSPYAAHARQLKTVAKHSCHCLCEKPLHWSAEPTDTLPAPPRGDDTAALVDTFVSRGRYLASLTQWPHTLPFFWELYPEVRSEPVREFSMLMGPIRVGPAMVLDAAPHPLSMLQSLLGRGVISDVRAEYLHDRQPELCLDFSYEHPAGVTAVSCRFRQCETAPRPASYSINGREVVRSIQMPSYKLEFRGAGRTIPLEDPLILLVREFLHNVANGAPVERQHLLDAVEALEPLLDAAVRALEIRK